MDTARATWDDGAGHSTSTGRSVLVTGATGYVGGRLVPRLLADGHAVRATRHSPDRQMPWWRDEVETVLMDAAEEADVRRAVRGVDTVYYLVHGLGGEDFTSADRQAAELMARAVDDEGVERVVYLSGLVPDGPGEELSPHLASRYEVERTLAASSATVLSLRAAIVLGSGSTSFEIVRQISERLPLQVVPVWMTAQVQPVAVVDVVEALAGALTVDAPTRSYDIGGPDRLSYPRLLQTYARVAGLRRPQVVVPFLRAAAMGRYAGVLTDVPTGVVEALVESLRHDMVCAEEDFVGDLLPPGHRLLGLTEAVRRSLASPGPEPSPGERDPMGPMPQDPAWAGGGRPRAAGGGRSRSAAGGRSRSAGGR